MRLLCILLVTACGSSLRTSEEASDLSSSSWEVVGRITELDQIVPSATYTSSPRYRAVELDVPADTDVDVDVTAQTGTAVSFICTRAGKVVKSFSAHTSATLYGGTYFVVFREKSLAKTAFTVEVAGTSAADVMKARWQDLSLGGLAAHAVKSSALPKAAQAKAAAYAAKFGPAQTYAIDDFFAVSDNSEEQFWVDLFDASGKLVAHGYDGDSGPQISTWKRSPYDPSL